VPKISVEDYQTLMAEEAPWAAEAGLTLESIERGRARARLPVDASLLRPGGTVAGPAMMSLADATMYAVVLSMIGPVKLTVTTSFNINFLRRPALADLIAEGRMLKLGRRLAVMEVTVYSDGSDKPVAHATGTYSIPPDAAA
jgi:uncharacterized protein (TIGR00369 family)